MSSYVQDPLSERVYNLPLKKLTCLLLLNWLKWAEFAYLQFFFFFLRKIFILSLLHRCQQKFTELDTSILRPHFVCCHLHGGSRLSLNLFSFFLWEPPISKLKWDLLSLFILFVNFQPKKKKYNQYTLFIAYNL